MTDFPDFDLTIPLVRRNADGSTDTRDITLRIPAEDQETAVWVAQRIGYEILDELPDVGPNNRHGWRIASYGPAAEPAHD